MGRPRVSDPTTTQAGYVMVTGPSGTRILEHRLVAAETLGRELSGNEKIVHKDKNRANNQPENLVIAVTTYVSLTEYARRST
jgi:hypothetical protein